MIPSSACQPWRADQPGQCRTARRPMPAATPRHGTRSACARGRAQMPFFDPAFLAPHQVVKCTSQAAGLAQVVPSLILESWSSTACGIHLTLRSPSPLRHGASRRRCCHQPTLAFPPETAAKKLLREATPAGVRGPQAVPGMGPSAEPVPLEKKAEFECLERFGYKV